MSTLLIIAMLAFAVALGFASVVMGWRQCIAEERRRAPWPAPAAEDRPWVTLIVPARNARETLPLLLQDLHAGSYPRDRTEVLVVDDGSTDGTADPVRGMLRSWPQLRLLASEGPGKKAAIATGVRAAQGGLIVLTDADARCGPRRVERIVAAWRATGADLLLMPVRTEGEGVLGRLQAAEGSALLGVAAATALGRSPLLANGANMAFTRAAFDRVQGFQGDRWASGDDIFLLQRMKRAGMRIRYALDREALATVTAEPDLRGFWQQRLRWAGKMRGVKGGGTLLGLLGLLLPWALLVLTCAIDLRMAVGQGLFRSVLLVGSAWLLWALPVLALVREADRFLDRPSSTIGNAFSLLAFSVYAPVIAVASLFVRPLWKGRRI